MTIVKIFRKHSINEKEKDSIPAYYVEPTQIDLGSSTSS
jgi:hypothetical protein